MRLLRIWYQIEQFPSPVSLTVLVHIIMVTCIHAHELNAAVFFSLLWLLSKPLKLFSGTKHLRSSSPMMYTTIHTTTSTLSQWKLFLFAGFVIILVQRLVLFSPVHSKHYSSISNGQVYFGFCHWRSFQDSPMLNISWLIHESYMIKDFQFHGVSDKCFVPWNMKYKNN